MPHLAIHGASPVRTRPFPDWPVYTEEDAKAVSDTIISGKWGSSKGNRVHDFEEQFSAFQQARHGIAVTNGTTALSLALQSVGLTPGDEVIIPAYTFIATSNTVMMSNAVPIFVDIDPETYNINPDLVEQAITPRTRAIMPVHFAGLPADMDRLLDIAQRHNLALVEDAAQAHGAQWKGKGVGSIGDISGFSFQASKNLNAGEGGIILTDNDELAGIAGSLTDCGRSENGLWYGHYRLAGNHRMTEMQGALLLSQMTRLEEQTNRRHENGDYLTDQLRQINGIVPAIRPDNANRHARHLYIFRYKADAFGGAPKSRFIDAMNAEGIPTSAGYSLPLYKQPVFREKNFGVYHQDALREIDFDAIHLPETAKACEDEAVWFTQNVLLGEKEDMDDIVRAIAKIRERRQELARA
jgi:dTDP-4-amino-4,6-dideoxygalactose transaminase